MKPYLLIGKVLKPQGIRGEVKVLPATDDPARFLSLKTAYVRDEGGGMTPVKVLSARVQQGAAVVVLEGVGDRDAAEKWRGRELYVDRAGARKLPEGRYFIDDLLGCGVVTSEGKPLGELAEVYPAGGADVWMVKGTAGGKGFSFPALKKVLLSVDVEAKKIVLDEKALAEVAVHED